MTKTIIAIIAALTIAIASTNAAAAAFKNEYRVVSAASSYCINNLAMNNYSAVESFIEGNSNTLNKDIKQYLESYLRATGSEDASILINYIAQFIK